MTNLDTSHNDCGSLSARHICAVLALVLLSACAVDPLAPAANRIDRVNEMSTQTVDIMLPDANGDQHAARVYFNEDASDLVTRFAAQATVTTRAEIDARLGLASASQEALGEDPDDLVDGEDDPTKPWMYVRIDSSDGIKRGFTAPWAAVGQRLTLLSVGLPVEAPPADTEGPAYSAQLEYWGTNSSGPASEWEFAAEGCFDTALVEGDTAVPSAIGTQRLRDGAVVVDSETGLDDNDNFTLIEHSNSSTDWNTTATCTAGCYIAFATAGSFSCVD